MNILYIVHDNKKGGAALSFLEMISYIKRTNKVVVIVPHKHGYVPQELSKMGIEHHNAHFFWWKVLPPQMRGLRCLKICAYRFLNFVQGLEVWRMKRIIRKKEVDIIHSNSSVISFGSLLSKKTDIPHVWHLREYGEEDFGLVRVVSKEKYIRHMNQRNQFFVAISESIMKKYEKEVSKEQIALIYNGVSTNDEKKEIIDTKTEKVICFLISGNCCEAKGQQHVIEAIRQLKIRGVNQYKVFFAGSGDFSGIKKLSEKYMVNEYCVFCGMVDNMMQLRKEVDVEIVASKCEAFGRVTIEAMRMSNPVIGTNSGGTSELVQDGYTGFLYQYGDFYQLADLMQRFIDDYDLLKMMGRNAYNQVKEKFTPEQNAEAILDLYKKVVKEYE